MKRISYVHKTVLPYLFLLVGALIFISISTSVYFEKFVLINWEKELIAEANLISEQLVVNSSKLEPSVDLFNKVKRFSEITEDRVTIILANGNVVAESDHDLTTMENHLLRPEIHSALQGIIQPTIRLSTTMHQRYIYIATPIYNGHIVTGVVRLAKSLDSYDKTILGFRIILYIIAGLSTFLALFMMLLQSSKKLNPLRKISEEIYTMTNGELKTIAGEDRKDEIGMLISAHNSLVEKINSQIQTFRTEQTKLSAILSNMTDGVILVNAECIVTLINPSAQKLFNYTQVPAPKDTLIEVVRQHQIVDLWNQTLKSGKTQSATIQTSLDKDNIQVIASLLGPVLPGEVLLLLQDLTLLRKLETVRKDFVSNISHELRTPLASLKALTETLQNGALQDPSVSNLFLDQMNEEIDNLSQIVHELLELSKIESGQVPLDIKTATIEEIVSRPVERMRLQAERAGLSIETLIPTDLPDLKVDLTRIHQVFVNLIHNAIKFTPPGGKITIKAQLQINEIIFDVSDTGAGIAPNDLQRIFERFYKSDRSRSGGGTGLGLSISRHIVEAHGGKIWAESTQGEGSSVIFSIPC